MEEQKAQKEDRFLRGRQIAYLIYDYIRVTGVNESALDFTVVLRNDDIQEIDTRWDDILLSMEHCPLDDILESLYKFKIRECEKLKTVLGLYDLEVHLKQAGPDYHRLKTMVKRSIEQNFRIKNFGARTGNYERNAGSRIRGQNSVYKEFLEIVGNGKSNGQCSRGDDCSFRHDVNQRAKKTQPNSSQRSSTRKNVRNASRTQVRKF